MQAICAICLDILNVISVRKWRAALPPVTWQVKGLKGTVKKTVGQQEKLFRDDQ